MKKKAWIAAIALGVSVSLALFWKSSSEESGSEPTETKEAAIDASYQLDVEMGEPGIFQISASIEVKNNSNDAWNEVGFYLVPNAMNSEATESYEDEAAAVDISSVTASGVETNYTLANNSFMVEMSDALEPGESREVLVDYELELPKDGMRLSQVGNNYYLAHWYPMLANYEEGWQLHDYDPKGESYTTGYGNYTVNYELPDDYFVATSAPDGSIHASSSGTVQGSMIKDFYMAVMDPGEWEVKSRKVNDTIFRVFVPAESDILVATTDLAAEAFTYFEEKIGGHPSKELDIIANDGYMEYPNIIEVAADKANLEYVLVHEIAHQWFYSMVTSDPYEEAWLDESLTEFAMALFLNEYAGDHYIGFQGAAAYAESLRVETYANLPLDEFEESVYYATVYGEVPIVLKEFFDDRGGHVAALEFLSAYYREFQYRQVETDDFRRFFDSYFKGDQQPFLDSWLQ